MGGITLEKEQDLFLSVSDMEKLRLFERVRQLKIMEISYRDDLKAHQSLDFDIKDINFRQAAAQMNKSYGSIYNTYDGIIQDMKELLGKDDPTIEEIFSVDNDQYHFFLVSHSDAYNFMMAILEDTCQSFDDFYQECGNSKATALRHLKPMRLFLKNFNVRITYEKMRFVGEETDVRLAISAMFWEATRGFAWPFKTISEEESEWLVNQGLEAFQVVAQPNPMTFRVYQIYATVNCLRIYHGHFVERNAKIDWVRYPNLNVYESFMTEDSYEQFVDSDFAKIIQYYRDLTPARLMNESYNMYNLVNCSLSIVPCGNEKADEILDHIQEYDTKIYDFVGAFLQSMPYNIQRQFNLSDEIVKLYRIALMRVLIGGLAFGNSYYQMVEVYTGEKSGLSSIDLPEFKKTIRNILQHLFEQNEFQDFQDKVNLLTNAVYKILLRVVVMFSDHFAVQVYLSIEENQLYRFDMVETIDSLPYVQLVQDPNAADLIVTTSSHYTLDPTQHDIYIFKWEHDANSAQYGQLISLIRDIWTEKKISK